MKSMHRALIESAAGLKGVTVAMLLACLSCSDDKDKAPADAGTDSAVTTEAGLDQGTISTLEVQVLGMDNAVLADYTTRPLEGVTVAADLPGGERVEQTTGADGKVTFEDVDWSQGTAAVTAHADGYMLQSRTGLDGTGGELTMILFSIDGPDMIEVSGTAKNMDPTATYLGVGATVYSGRYEANSTTFSLPVLAGEPFTLYGLHGTWHVGDPENPRGIKMDCQGWTKASHPGSTEPVTLDLDFADALTPVQVSGTIELPATAKNLLDSAFRVQFWMNQQVWGLLLGLATQVTEGETGTFDWEGEYLEIEEAQGVYGVYAARVSTTDWGHGSQVRVDGYPEEGVKVGSFIDVPTLVKPANLTTPIKWTDSIEWQSNNPEASPRVVLINPSTGQGMWQIIGQPDMTSMVLPDPPSTVVDELATESAMLSARVALCADMDADSQACYRWAGGPLFQIEGTPTKTVSTSGRLLEYQTLQPVEGAEVCVMDEAEVPCATTDADGTFTLSDVPNDRDVIVTMKKAGYFSLGTHHGQQQAANHGLGYLAVPSSLQPDIEAGIGEALDPEMGTVVVTVLGTLGPKAGATIELEPQAGTGPVYIGADSLPDSSLDATSTVGAASVWNVPPGDYTVTVSSPGQTCEVLLGWKGTSSDTARVQSVADLALGTAFRCK